MVSYSTALVSAPATEVDHHATATAYITEMLNPLPGMTKIDYHLAVFRLGDLAHVFPNIEKPSFYLTSNKMYLAIPSGDQSTEEEAFYKLFHIPDDVVFASTPHGSTFMRFKIIASEVSVAETPGFEDIVFNDEEAYRIDNPTKTWDAEKKVWVPKVSSTEPLVDKVRLNMKDIPLNTRDGRRLVRNSIELHREALTNSFVRSGAQIPFDEWMTVNQGVNMNALQDLEKIDSLTDAEYVEAMVTFKKAEVQAYHAKAVKDGETDMHLFDWTQLKFGEPFHDIGRKEAMAEVHQLYIAEDVEQLDDEFIDPNDSPATFMVSFDGTIVEDQFPSIGPATPYAMELLKMLIEKGHNVIILSDREGDLLNEMFDFLKNKVRFVASTKFYPASGLVRPHDMVFLDEDHRPDGDDSFEIDYLIDVRQFAAPTINISGHDYPATLFWDTTISAMLSLGYIDEEAVQTLLKSLEEDQ